MLSHLAPPERSIVDRSVAQTGRRGRARQFRRVVDEDSELLAYPDCSRAKFWIMNANLGEAMIHGRTLLRREVTGAWIERAIRTCRYLGVEKPPSFRDFAHELAEIMHRRIKDTKHDGVRHVRSVHDLIVPPSS